MVIALHYIGWIVGGVLAYFVNRVCFRRRQQWTVGNRALTIIVAALFGPLALVAFACAHGIAFLVSIEKEARW